MKVYLLQKTMADDINQDTKWQSLNFKSISEHCSGSGSYSNHTPCSNLTAIMLGFTPEELVELMTPKTEDVPDLI